LVRMQQAGVAVQVPNELWEGSGVRPKHLGKKLHAAEGWLVNPFGAVLDATRVGKPARKATTKTKRRTRAKTKKRVARRGKRPRGA
jgi:hypothetical protein